MVVDLPYGDGTVSMELADRTEVIRRSDVDVHMDLEAELTRLLESPKVGRSFTKELSKARSLAIAVDTSVDSPQVEFLLRHLLRYIDTSTSCESVCILSPFSAGLDVTVDTRSVTVVSRSSLSDENVELVGETPSFSTPVSIDSDYLHSDVHIAIGSVRPHPIFGVTGGSRSALTCISSTQTVLRNEKLGLTHFTVPHSKDSAVRTDANESVRLAGLDYVFNTVVDHNGDLDSLVVGAPEVASVIGYERSLESARVEMNHRADIALVSAGGCPYDSTLHSSLNALVVGYDATVHGGVVVLVAECADGLGPQGFVSGITDCESEAHVIKRGEVRYEHGLDAARLFWRVRSSRKIVLVSGLPQTIEEQIGCIDARSPQEGLEQAKALVTSNKQVVVIPDGIFTLPQAP